MAEAGLRAARPDDWEAIAQVHAEAWQAAYSGFLPPPVMRRFALPGRRRLWQGLLAAETPPLVELVETAAGGIAGFAWCRRVAEPDAAFEGEIVAIAVRPGHERRGLGRRLMGAGAARLAASGAGSLYLWVYRENRPARAFYEALGGRMVDSDVEHCEGLELPIVAYAWKPIDDLIALSARPLETP